jgi:hypothetical protein
VLVDQWKSLGSELPDQWSTVEVSLRLEQASETETAARLLGPAQPYRTAPNELRFYVARDGSAQSIDGIQRLLLRIDKLRCHGQLTIVSTAKRERPAERVEEPLVVSWERAASTLPADWSNALAELEVDSTDYIETGSLYCAPLNLRRDGDSTRLRFLAARTTGYGASRAMVRRCLERCDAAGITGRVRILDAVSAVDPASTQGPLLTV